MWHFFLATMFVLLLRAWFFESYIGACAFSPVVLALVVTSYHLCD